MYMNGFFGENLFDEFFNFPRRVEVQARRSAQPPMISPQTMHTDVKESDTGYDLAVELPGYDKDNIEVNLNDGYLTITASSESNKEEKDDKGVLIRQERYVGTRSRSFYVGNDVTDEDIKAKYENGVLHLEVPKKEKEEAPAIEEKHNIPIEG